MACRIKIRSGVLILLNILHQVKAGFIKIDTYVPNESFFCKYGNCIGNKKTFSDV